MKRGHCALVALLSLPAMADRIMAVDDGRVIGPLFDGVALGPTVGAAAAVSRFGFGPTVSLGLGFDVFEAPVIEDPNCPQPNHLLRRDVCFHQEPERIKLHLALEVLLSFMSSGLEGTGLIYGTVKPLTWRWLSLGVHAGLGANRNLFTGRVGPDVTFHVHPFTHSQDSVFQFYARYSFAIGHRDVFADQAELGLRVLFDILLD